MPQYLPNATPEEVSTGTNSLLLIQVGLCMCKSHVR